MDGRATPTIVGNSDVEGYKNLEEAFNLEQSKVHAMRHAKRQSWSEWGLGGKHSTQEKARSVETLAQMIGDWALHTRNTSHTMPWKRANLNR